MRPAKRQDQRVVWIVAAILVAAALILAVDIVAKQEKQSARADPPGQRTELAAKQAGASQSKTER